MYDKLKNDMIKAMKTGDKFTLTVIRMAKGAIDKEKIDKKIDITDELVIDVLAHEIKTRTEAKTEFQKAARNDLIESLDKEINILKEYLPEPLNDDEAIKIIEEALIKEQATTIKDMGKVMKNITPKLKGRYDMKKASMYIKNKLN